MRLTPVIACILLSAAAMLPAAEQSIHSMVVGDKVLELVEERPLTFKTDGRMAKCAISPNGSYVAYLKTTDDSFVLSIAKTNGGFTRSYSPAPASSDEIKGRPIRPGRNWLMGPIVWSPDSRRLAMVELRRKPSPQPEPGKEDEDRPVVESYLSVLGPDGRLQTSIPLTGNTPRTHGYPEDLMFSPDSTEVAVVVHWVTSELEGRGNSTNQLHLVNLATGTSSVCGTFEESDLLPRLLSWAKDGSSVFGQIDNVYGKLSVLDGSIEMIYDDSQYPDTSPFVRFSSDAKYVTRDMDSDDPGLYVKNTRTGTYVQVTKTASKPIQWYANGNLLMYSQPREIKDDSGQRVRTLNTLWLAALSDRGSRSMCVALDFDDTGWSPTFSADYRRMAYLSGGCVHLASLEWRTPTADEKVEAGLKLTEEEEKTVLLGRRRTICTGFEQYLMDTKNAIPSSAADLQPYMGKDTFYRPGTGELIFKSLLGPDDWTTDEEGHRTLVPEARIGEFDSGYSWKVVVYVDGRSEVEEKK